MIFVYLWYETCTSCKLIFLPRHIRRRNATYTFTTPVSAYTHLFIQHIRKQTHYMVGSCDWMCLFAPLCAFRDMMCVLCSQRSPSMPSSSSLSLFLVFIYIVGNVPFLYQTLFCSIVVGMDLMFVAQISYRTSNEILFLSVYILFPSQPPRRHIAPVASVEYCGRDLSPT